jgi:hypothetical protein
MGRLVQENEIETYLHAIRRGEAEFQQTFGETYSGQKEKFHQQLDLALGGLSEKIARSGKLSQAELEHDGDELHQLLGKLDTIAGLVGAWRFRRRVSQARGEFHKPAPHSLPEKED